MVDQRDQRRARLVRHLAAVEQTRLAHGRAAELPASPAGPATCPPWCRWCSCRWPTDWWGWTA